MPSLSGVHTPGERCSNRANDGDHGIAKDKNYDTNRTTIRYTERRKRLTRCAGYNGALTYDDGPYQRTHFYMEKSVFNSNDSSRENRGELRKRAAIRWFRVWDVLICQRKVGTNSSITNELGGDVETNCKQMNADEVIAVCI